MRKCHRIKRKTRESKEKARTPRIILVHSSSMLAPRLDKWFDEANKMMKSTWIKACKVDCLKPSWRLMEFWF